MVDPSSPPVVPHWVTAWSTSDKASAVVLGFAVLAIGVMALTPRVVRRRLRTGLFFAGVFGVLRLAVPFFADDGPTRDAEALTFLFGALAVTRFAFVFVVDLALERGGRRPINALVREVLQAAVYLVVALGSLRAVGFTPSSLLATGTVVSVVVGLALQDTLGNLAAGVSVQIERPAAVGDWIRFDRDSFGRIVAMSWRSITVQTNDRHHLVIPNNVFSKAWFVNYSRPEGPKREALVYVTPFEVAPSRAHEALLAAAADCSEVLAEPPPSVLTLAANERGIPYSLRFFIADLAHRDRIVSEVATRVWYQLHRRKISLAIPLQETFNHELDERTRSRDAKAVIQDRRAAIDAVDFLRPLPESAKNVLAQRGHRRLFAEGETILRQGDEGRTFYIVRRGQVVVTIDGQEVNRLGPGDFFGELALLTAKQRHASVIATAETEVFEIDEKMFQDVLQEEPQLAAQVAEIVGQRQAQLEAVRIAEDGRPSHDFVGWRDEILTKVKKLFVLD